MKRLFSFSGRARRREFWLVMVGLVVGAAVLLWGTLQVFGQVAGPQGLWVVLLVFVSFAVVVRRLHDRGRRWWWIVPFWLLPNALSAPFDRSPEPGPVVLGLALIGAVLGIWGLVELGFLPGTKGENRFGPDPRS